MFVPQSVYNKKEEFFLFSTIFEATMLDRRLVLFLQASCHTYLPTTSYLPQYGFAQVFIFLELGEETPWVI